MCIRDRLHAVTFDATNKVLKMPIYIKTRKTWEVFTAFLFKDINMQTLCSNYIILKGWKENTLYISIYIDSFANYSIWYSYFKCINVLRFRYFIQPPNFVTQFNHTAQPFPWPSFSPQNVVLSFCHCNQISATSPIKFKTPVWWNVQYTLVCTKT